MKPNEIIADLRASEIDGRVEEPVLLRYLAGCVLTAELKNGMRVLDSTDFGNWLRELATVVEAEKRG